MITGFIFHVDVNAAYLSWEAVYRLRHLGAKEDLRKQAAGGRGRYSSPSWDHSGKVCSCQEIRDPHR